MSPQHGSFSSGCKYKSNRESSNKDEPGDAPTTPISSRISEQGQSLVFMIKIQHRKISVNIVLHMDHSQVHSSSGGVVKAALPTGIIMVGQHRRMMITTTGHLVDHLTHDTVRATSRNIIEVMATPENIISQRVTVSLNQNGCSLDQVVGLN